MNEYWAKLLDKRGFLTIRQFGQLLRECYPQYSVSYPTLINWCRDGKISHYIVGAQRRIKAEDVKTFCAGVDGGASAPPDTPQATDNA